MPTVKVVDLIARAHTITNDVAAVRWTSIEMQQWLNDSYREIVLVRPDANTISGTITCIAGTRQNIATTFPTAIALVDITRNLAATSTKRAVQLADRHSLDEQLPLWHAETASDTIQYYMYDPRLQRDFLVYPPATIGAQLEVAYSVLPTPHALTETQLNTSSTTDTIRLDDSYANAILDYMLYRAYSKDADIAANAQRAVGHYQAMQTGIAMKTSSDSASRPGAA